MKSRHLGVTVGALLTLVLGFVAPTAAQAATGYRLNWTYAGGGTGSQTYSSQYQWLVDLTHIDQRAFTGASGVVKLVVTDLGNNAAVTATYDAAGIHTYSNGLPGQDYWWDYGFGPGCQVFVSEDNETTALATYLTEVVLTITGVEDGATIATPAHNAFGVGYCGTVG